jgi:protein FRG1
VRYSSAYLLGGELIISREAQTWGLGKSIVSAGDRKDLKKARKEGKLAEAMLDRRAALKRSVLPTRSYSSPANDQ